MSFLRWRPMAGSYPVTILDESQDSLEIGPQNIVPVVFSGLRQHASCPVHPGDLGRGQLDDRWPDDQAVTWRPRLTRKAINCEETTGGGCGGGRSDRFDWTVRHWTNSLHTTSHNTRCMVVKAVCFTGSKKRTMARHSEPRLAWRYMNFALVARWRGLQIVCTCYGSRDSNKCAYTAALSPHCRVRQKHASILLL